MITKTKPNPNCYFNELKPGDVFEYGGALFMKTSYGNLANKPSMNAACLETGQLTTFAEAGGPLRRVYGEFKES